jgi:FkbM family methyltransferase
LFKKIHTYSRDSLNVLTDSRIRAWDRVVFSILQPLAFVMNNGKEFKKARFLDGRIVAWQGRHLNLLLDHLHNHLAIYSHYYGNGKVIFDVGSSFGIFSSTANYLLPQATVYAYEPSVESASLFERNCGNIRNIHLIKKAIGDSTDVLHFSFDAEQPEESKVGERATEASYEVEQTTLDNELKRLGLHAVDLLKIDVEGHELAVLDGAKRMLGVTRCVIVETEVCNATKVLDLMNKAGFEWIDIGAVNRLVGERAGEIGNIDLVFLHRT